MPRQRPVNSDYPRQMGRRGPLSKKAIFFVFLFWPQSLHSSVLWRGPRVYGYVAGCSVLIDTLCCVPNLPSSPTRFSLKYARLSYFPFVGWGHHWEASYPSGRQLPVRLSLCPSGRVGQAWDIAQGYTQLGLSNLLLACFMVTQLGTVWARTRIWVFWILFLGFFFNTIKFQVARAQAS